MTYKVFGGTLSLTQSISQSPFSHEVPSDSAETTTIDAEMIIVGPPSRAKLLLLLLMTMFNAQWCKMPKGLNRLIIIIWA